MPALTSKLIRLGILVCAAVAVASAAYAQGQRKPHIVTAEKYAGSVFRIEVEDGESSLPRSGTAFPIHTAGPQDNPTVWFLTAAHVLFGPQARFESDATRLKRVIVRKGGGQSWEVDRSTIQVPPNWNTRWLDFAVMKVIGMGLVVTPVPLVNGVTEDETRVRRYWISGRPEFSVAGRGNGRSGARRAAAALVCSGRQHRPRHERRACVYR